MLLQSGGGASRVGARFQGARSSAGNQGELDGWRRQDVSEKKNDDRHNATSNNWTRKHTNSTMQIIERKCKAQTGCWDYDLTWRYIFVLVLWTVGNGKTLDKTHRSTWNLIPLDRAEVPDLSVSGDNFDLVEVDPHDPTTTSEPVAPMQSLNQLPVVTDLAGARSAWSRRSFPVRNRRTNKKKMRAISISLEGGVLNYTRTALICACSSGG